jgi:hypothetical protein
MGSSLRQIAASDEALDCTDGLLSQSVYVDGSWKPLITLFQKLWKMPRDFLFVTHWSIRSAGSGPALTKPAGIRQSETVPATDSPKFSQLFGRLPFSYPAAITLKLS